MNCLYDSPRFTVVHITYATPGVDVEVNCFELVDKNEPPQEVLLHGNAAHAFEVQMKKWQDATPEQDAVEFVLDCYMSLGRLPIVSH